MSNHSFDLQNSRQHHEEEGIQPLQLKPVIGPLKSRNNNDNSRTTFYQPEKLTQYFQEGEGKIIPLVSIDQDSSLITFNDKAAQFLEKFSQYDLAFIGVSGQKGSGKSFFLDKVLNLANIQANHFSTEIIGPGIYMWSCPCTKNNLKIFCLELANCELGDKNFYRLLPFVFLLCSGIILIEKMTSNQSQTASVMEELLENLNASWEGLLPQFLYSLRRKPLNQSQRFVGRGVRLHEGYLPDAKNSQFRGSNQQLIMHSFLNRKCISQGYIHRVSEVFKQALSWTKEKKHHQLVFNGRICIKYLKSMELNINKKNVIEMESIYQEIVGELYLTAYNYCVLCYHQALESALSDENPRSLEELLEIFDTASQKVLKKYQEFNLEQELHQKYQQKLFQHINSKQALILEINRKKANLQIRKSLQAKIDMTNLRKAWQQLCEARLELRGYDHWTTESFGEKLSKIVTRIGSGNNVDYLVMRQIEGLKDKISQRRNQLQLIRAQSKKIQQTNQQRETERKKLSSVLFQLNTKVEDTRKQIQNFKIVSEQTPETLQNEKDIQEKKYKRTSVTLETLKNSMKDVEQDPKVSQFKQNIQSLKSKQKLMENTLQQLGASLPTTNESKHKEKKQNLQPPK